MIPTYIALLRGINVSGQKLIKMAELKAHFKSFGAVNVRTYIQSGNVVFQHAAAAAPLRKKLEAHLAGKLGYPVSTLVKTAEDFRAIAAANPFEVSGPESGKRLYVVFLEAEPTPSAIKSIQPLMNEAERLVVRGLAAYAYYANGLGRAKLTGAVIERKLGRATMRNWNTVSALLDLATSKLASNP